MSFSWFSSSMTGIGPPTPATPRVTSILENIIIKTTHVTRPWPTHLLINFQPTVLSVRVGWSLPPPPEVDDEGHGLGLLSGLVESPYTASLLALSLFIFCWSENNSMVLPCRWWLKDCDPFPDNDCCHELREYGWIQSLKKIFRAHKVFINLIPKAHI